MKDYIQQPYEHANKVVKNWGDMALYFLIEYSKNNKRFLAEDVRESCKELLPPPPSERAWGAVMLRALKMGYIKKHGYSNVKNKKAHHTVATVWESIKKEPVKNQLNLF